MTKSFKTLIRLNNWQVDERRRALAERLRFLEALEDNVKALEAEIVNERRIAAASPGEAGLYFGAYIDGARNRRAKLDELIAATEAEADKAREAVREAFSELKKFEMAEESREQREVAERDRLDRIDLDEIGLTTHRYRGK